MERNYKLYVHTTPSGKRYYGITKLKPEHRWNNGKGYKNNQYFTRAIEKYGWDNITHEILFDDLTESEAKELEQYYIQWYDTANSKYGYNITLGGEGGNGLHPSEETKKKISENNARYWKGKQFSEEHKQKLSENHSHCWKGRHHTEESKQKMSKANKGKNHYMYGKHLPEETRKKMGEARKGKNNPKAKSVICLTTKKIFFTGAEGAERYNISKPNITQCCQGKRKSAGKYNGQKLVWKYLNYKHNKTYRIKSTSSMK